MAASTINSWKSWAWKPGFHQQDFSPWGFRQNSASPCGMHVSWFWQDFEPFILSNTSPPWNPYEITEHMRSATLNETTWRHYSSTKFVCHATEVIEAVDRNSHSRLHTVQTMCGQKFNAQWVRQFGDAEFGPNIAGCRGTGTRTAKNSMGASSLWSFGPKPRFVAICSVWLSNTWYIIAPFGDSSSSVFLIKTWLKQFQTGSSGGKGSMQW